MPSILKHTPKSHENTNTKIKLLNFRINQTSFCVTPNFYNLSQYLSKEQLNLILFLSINANRINYIEVSTNLIKRFIRLNKIIKSDLNHKTNSPKQDQKPTLNTYKRINTSYNYVVADIIFLINSHILIQLQPNTNKYMINPLYIYGHSVYNPGTKIVKLFNSFIDDFNAGKMGDDDYKLLCFRYYLICWKNYGNKAFYERKHGHSTLSKLAEYAENWLKEYDVGKNEGKS